MQPGAVLGGRAHVGRVRVDVHVPRPDRLRAADKYRVRLEVARVHSPIGSKSYRSNSGRCSSRSPVGLYTSAVPSAAGMRTNSGVPPRTIVPAAGPPRRT